MRHHLLWRAFGPACLYNLAENDILIWVLSCGQVDCGERAAARRGRSGRTPHHLVWGRKGPITMRKSVSVRDAAPTHLWSCWCRCQVRWLLMVDRHEKKVVAPCWLFHFSFECVCACLSNCLSVCLSPEDWSEHISKRDKRDRMRRCACVCVFHVCWDPIICAS